MGKDKRSSLANESNVPGPGSYTAKIQQATLPQFSIPKSNSSWIKPNFTPGPGTYESKLRNS